jgi:uncharacterized protein YukE
MAAGLAGVTVYQFMENTAISFTSPSNVSIIVSICPMFTAIFAQIWLREKHLNIFFNIGFLIAIIGIALVSFNGAVVLHLSPKGDLLALGSAVCWGFYSLFVSKINKSPISRNELSANMTNNYEEYDLNYNMNNFDNMISTINRNGFQRYQDEINDKKIIVSQLENSIAMLKNKICLCKSRTYSGLHKESKNRIKYENMLSVSNRYKNIGKTADNYKDDINNFQNKIAIINNETLKLKTIGFDIQNEINSMNEEIRKGNKAISDKQKEIENLLPALQLLRNHITSVKQKLFRYNNVKQNYLDELSYIGNSI